MNKRGFFSCVLLLLIPTLLLAADTTDAGIMEELLVTSQSLVESEEDCASFVTVITSEDIVQSHAETTAALVEHALGASFNSTGAVGSLQTVKIRGSNSTQVDIFLDGILMNSAHQGTFDLNSIPISMIDHIEIIRSGTGSLGKTNAVGGMVNIVTKKAVIQAKPFTVSVETGSFVPESYLDGDDSQQVNWIGLADAQKLDVRYSNAFGDVSLAVGSGGIFAQNNYTYLSTDETIRLRDNAGLWGIHGDVKVSYDLHEAGSATLTNLTNYQHLETPGSLSYLSATDFQNEFISTSNVGYQVDGLLDGLLDISSYGAYTFNQTEYQSYSLSIHDKQRADMGSDLVWRLSENVKVDTSLSLAWDGIESTEVGNHNRYTTSGSIASSIYLYNGILSVHPMVRVDHSNDFGLAPSVSLGIVSALSDSLSLQANVGYAHQAPTFSDLYWPDSYGMVGNPDLVPEKALSADIGTSWSGSGISYTGTVFVRNTEDLILWIFENSYYSPVNMGQAFFLGTEQSVELALAGGFTLHANYIFNYSWDLSNSQTFANNVRVPYVRMHTVNAGIDFQSGTWGASLDAQLLGEASNLDQVFLLDATIDWDINGSTSVYAAIDNVLNTRYSLSSGYPMPGRKLRLGGNLTF
ncbi:MAG: TonB-dependent receptor plug domain-containing protein [Sphaerochaetaceae bacterium]